MMSFWKNIFTSPLRIKSSFFYIFFNFLNILKLWTVKSLVYEFHAAAESTKFVNPAHDREAVQRSLVAHGIGFFHISGSIFVPLRWVFFNIYIYIYIHHSDGPINPSPRPPNQPIGPAHKRATDRARVTDPCTPRVDPHPRSKPRPNRADATPTKPTDPTWLSHFRGSLSHFDKALAIFQFQPVIFATLLLQCSNIFAIMLNHFFYNAQPF
jgi:hypothetical protein